MNSTLADKQLKAAIGRALRTARKALGLTQAAMAERVGISTHFYANIERGNAFPSVKTLYRLTVELELNVDQALGLDAPIMADEETSARELDSPVHRRLFRRLRKARPMTLHIVGRVLKDLRL